RPVEKNLVAIDRETAGGDDVGDIAGRDRAVQLARVASLSDGDERLALELGGDGLSLALAGEVVGLELGALAFEADEVVLVGAQGLALRQQEVAGVAVADGHDIAHLAEAPDALEKDDLHGGISWFGIRLISIQALIGVSVRCWRRPRAVAAEGYPW